VKEWRGVERRGEEGRGGERSGEKWRGVRSVCTHTRFRFEYEHTHSPEIIDQDLNAIS
jgi:hypothetical protein